MENRIDMIVLGNTASAFLAFVFTVCVAFDVAFPGWAMSEAWAKLLPGFEGIGWRSYFIGLVESYAYGWLFAVVWAPPYNFFWGMLVGLPMLLWWAFAIFAIVVIARWITTGASGGGQAGEDRALAVLRERYARGEIGEEEFDKRKRDLA